MAKARKFYVVEGVFNWPSEQERDSMLSKYAEGSFGFAPVFTNKRKAELFCKKHGCKYRVARESGKTKKGGAT